MSEQADEKPFRVYVLKPTGEPFCVATCDGDSLGFCLLTLHDDGELDGPVGIMYRPPGEEHGHWLANPFSRRGGA